MIESAKNPLFKKLLSLTQSKGLKKEAQALVSGEKITKEIAKSSNTDSFWVTTNEILPSSKIPKQKVLLSKELFKMLDVCGTQKSLLCCNYPKPKKFSTLNPDLATLYVAASDPTNLGALVRSSVAFQFPQIVLLKEAAHPFLPRSIRGSSGTVFKTDLFEGPSIRDLHDPEILALDKKGESLSNKKLPKKLKLLVGEEGQGIPENFKGKRLWVPISQKVESLNVSVAASLVIYEWKKTHTLS